MPEKPSHTKGPRYSDDRLSLAQEIRNTLKVRGFWTPSEWAGPDLITAVAKALDETSAAPCLLESLENLVDFINKLELPGWAESDLREQARKAHAKAKGESNA